MFFKSWQKGMKEENANWSSMVYRQKAMILPITPNFSDSILVESSSQSASSKSSRQEQLNRTTVLDIFDDTQVYLFYSKDEVNYSWLDKDLGIKEIQIPKMSSSDLVNYLRLEIKGNYNDHCKPANYHIDICSF
ncbi:uncharacterized protein LOC124190084 isoform X1 [Daphnia pulex]|uniref:uncharacterized protein LOC124190084 isoform X1 n=1 Tax=Daphnia pulex TaxID=6669 RepID=UPI001EE056B0|nr:uncharacterized protein LOC124190084 isoform X1 [Daphnia pulex]